MTQLIDETEFILAAREAKVKYIVKLSTFPLWISTYAGPFYARTHHAVENLLAKGHGRPRCPSLETRACHALRLPHGLDKRKDYGMQAPPRQGRIGVSGRGPKFVTAGGGSILKLDPGRNEIVGKIVAGDI